MPVPVAICTLAPIKACIYSRTNALANNVMMSIALIPRAFLLMISATVLSFRGVLQHRCRVNFTKKPPNTFFRLKVTHETTSYRQYYTNVSESYLSKHRFWSINLCIDIDPHVNSTTTTVDYIKNYISSNTGQEGNRIPKAETGLIIVPRFSLLLPIHEGQLQPQHAIIAENVVEVAPQESSDAPSSLNITVCGFSPRAQHVSISPLEEERPINLERLAALDKALSKVTDTSGEELLSSEFAGTPPAKIYRSFVAPRPKARHILEPVDRAAGRTAAQIELALRQVRADRAAYLINTDRSPDLLTPAGSVSGRSRSENTQSTNSLADGEGGEWEENTSFLKANDVISRTVHPVAFVLDNVRSAFNVGSIFRSAETAGAAEIVTCGITAHPPHPKLRKTAFSAVDVVPCRHFDDARSAVRQLRIEGYHIVVMETTERSKEYTRTTYPKKTALVLGNEVTGVDPRIMELADQIVQIPTYGVKNSLNVASAAPVVLFEILRQWNDPGNEQSVENLS